jgi:hypothetical protein
VSGIGRRADGKRPHNPPEGGLKSAKIKTPLLGGARGGFFKMVQRYNGATVQQLAQSAGRRAQGARRIEHGAWRSETQCYSVFLRG